MNRISLKDEYVLCRNAADYKGFGLGVGFFGQGIYMYALDAQSLGYLRRVFVALPT